MQDYHHLNILKPASPAGFLLLNSLYTPDIQTATAKAGCDNQLPDLQDENER